MTYPPPPGGWQDPAGEQPTYIDPISGQPATVSSDPAQASPAAAPAQQPTQPAYPTYPGYPTGAPQPTQPPYPTDPQQPAPGYPAAQPQYPQPGYQAYPTYPAYPGYPMPGAGARNNGLAIASLCVSLGGLVFLVCYGGGGLLGIVGAILGHVAKSQIKQRGEAGRGMALAGIIIGWVSVALGVLVLIGWIWLFRWASTQDLN
ncbi:hypothetical protein GCM10023322_53760 [Rugosimonospora acidiphila]|uniref:DUF4190 domain-containing protein n=1 Tax=Rugosimonospora acidiphila TaxID=556531 RepID=A0ABP9SC67_9ACTN